MSSDWVRNDPKTASRLARLFLNNEEYSSITLRTVQGSLIFHHIRGQTYDRVDIDESADGNFYYISYSVFTGKRNYRYRAQRGRKLIHTMVLIKDEVQDIFREK